MAHRNNETNKMRESNRMFPKVSDMKIRKCYKVVKMARGKLKSLWDHHLLVAASCNNTESVELLLRRGASANTADFYGRSALLVAASKGYTDIVRTLLEGGADPNQVDRLGNTALHLAACTQNFNIISLLVKAGADVTKTDSYGQSPIDLAQGKLRLLHKRWKEGAIEMVQVRSELQLIIDFLISVLQRRSECNVDELQLMKLSINSESAEDQMSKLLLEFDGIQIT